eukprot:TRINITY_DN22795_c0_g1_i1.p1 TRINITY_DN22795_c0_g1~~TRINITY_DN22795_c0_g1_i1.p1  ORF type:complete len:761 (+),score=240.04 TRINITY_DN22795_c0_g1_i1:40-2283(+)
MAEWQPADGADRADAPWLSGGAGVAFLHAVAAKAEQREDAADASRLSADCRAETPPEVLRRLADVYGVPLQDAQRVVRRLRRAGVVASVGVDADLQLDQTVLRWLRAGQAMDTSPQPSPRVPDPSADVPDSEFEDCVMIFETKPLDMSEKQIDLFDVMDETLHFFHPAGISRDHQVKLFSSVSSLITAINLVVPRRPAAAAETVLRVGTSLICLTSLSVPSGVRIAVGEQVAGGALLLAAGSPYALGAEIARRRVRELRQYLSFRAGPLEDLRARCGLAFPDKLRILGQMLVAEVGSVQVSGRFGEAGSVRYHPCSTQASACMRGSICWVSSIAASAAAERAVSTALLNPAHLGACLLLSGAVVWHELPLPLLRLAGLAVRQRRLRAIMQQHAGAAAKRKRLQLPPGAAELLSAAQGSVFDPELHGLSRTSSYEGHAVLVEAMPVWLPASQCAELSRGKPVPASGGSVPVAFRRSSSPLCPRQLAVSGGSPPDPLRITRSASEILAARSSRGSPLSVDRAATGPLPAAAEPASDSPWLPAHLSKPTLAAEGNGDAAAAHQSFEMAQCAHHTESGQWLCLLTVSRQRGSLSTLMPVAAGFAKVTDSAWIEAAAQSLKEVEDAMQAAQPSLQAAEQAESGQRDGKAHEGGLMGEAAVRTGGDDQFAADSALLLAMLGTPVAGAAPGRPARPTQRLIASRGIGHRMLCAAEVAGTRSVYQSPAPSASLSVGLPNILDWAAHGLAGAPALV